MQLFRAALALVTALGLPRTAASSLRGNEDRILAEEYHVTEHPSQLPSSSPTTCETECEVDEDCTRICDKPSFYGPGTCVVAHPISPPTPPPTEIPPTITPNPTESTPTTPSPTVCDCVSPDIIPDECEVELLIDMMDVAVSMDLKLLAQWTRAAFHDAGTFDQTIPEGGANGCLMNHNPPPPCDFCLPGGSPPGTCTTCPMRDMPENQFLDAPLNALEVIKNDWHASPLTCINVSSADILQFAIFFATVRQSGTPGLEPAKRATLVADFQWGRPDETNCNITSTHNLPDFQTASGPLSVPRCRASGGEIKLKLMDRNGFTSREANVLIGAHTIGQIRNTFAPGFVGPWVPNGSDTGPTGDGPVFDNAYHDFLINHIVENTLPDFVSAPTASVAPFDIVFPNWFKDSTMNRLHLDTDVILAFDSTDSAVHPHFRPDSVAFAGSNALFLGEFFSALKKMSSLGVTVALQHAGPCEGPCGAMPSAAPSGGSGGGGSGGEGGAGGPILGGAEVIDLVKGLGVASATADESLARIQEGRKASGEIDRITDPVQTSPVEDPIKLPNHTEFFVDWSTNSCFRDATSCPGEVYTCAEAPDGAATFESIEECCAGGLGWADFGFCTSRSVGSFTNGWIANQQALKCFKDCDPALGPPCANPEHNAPSDRIFDTAQECCATSLSWVDIDSCASLSGTPPPPPPPTNLPTPLPTAPPTPLPTNPPTPPPTTSPTSPPTNPPTTPPTAPPTPLPTNPPMTPPTLPPTLSQEPSRFYVDGSTNICFKDAPPCPSEVYTCMEAPAWARTYASVEECCAGGLGWADFGFCTSRSVGGFTNGWITNQQEQKCFKDCDPALGPPCANPEHNSPSIRIFDTAQECCAATLGWVNIDSCTSLAALSGSLFS